MRRLRARFDYLVFLGAREWPVVVSALGVLLGLVTLLPSAVALVLSVMALALGITTLVRDVRQFRNRWSAYEFSVIAAPFPREEVPVPAAYPAAGYLHVENRGTALVSDEMDRALRERSYALEVDEKPYRLPPRLKATAPYVLPIRARGRLLFNGSVVGMRGEPLPGAGGGASIRVHRARFFDAQCSNELCSMRITERETGEEFDPRRQVLADTAGRIRTLAESELADVVGISTIAFTSDGSLVLVRQSDRNSASPLLLAPSGSGSLEPRDLLLDGTQREDLGHAVREGMERELCEETGLSRWHVRGTELVGFARWMERGAKPEFFGVTRLSVTSEQVRERKPLGAERLYSAGVLLVELDLDALGRELRGGADLMSASALPARLRDEGSLPLLLAVRAAALGGVGWTGQGDESDLDPPATRSRG